MNCNDFLRGGRVAQSADSGLDPWCPADCIGGHRFGIISAAGQDGVQTDGTVNPGDTATVVVRPQQRCQPIRLWVGEVEANNFNLVSAVIGTENLLATTGQMPLFDAIYYSRTVPFKKVICEISEEVTVKVKNISGAALTFRALMTAYLIKLPGAAS